MNKSALKTMDTESSISSIEDIIADVKIGKPVIIIDDETRENEGDLIVAAEMITPKAINFMIREGGGFVCLPMAKEIAQRLNLNLQERRNVGEFQAPFTTSIEAAHGVTTGVSVDDRFTTIKAAINPDASPDDISTPGHIFPLLAQDGGVLTRRGHTEASVDLARLAGFSPAGVLCEIMNEDGSMARLPDLEIYAKKHDLKIGTIEDLAKYKEALK